MTAQEVEENLRRFNAASLGSHAALERLQRAAAAHAEDEEFQEALAEFLGFVDTMISTSAELIGVVGPLKTS